MVPMYLYVCKTLFTNVVNFYINSEQPDVGGRHLQKTLMVITRLR